MSLLEDRRVATSRPDSAKLTSAADISQQSPGQLRPVSETEHFGYPGLPGFSREKVNG